MIRNPSPLDIGKSGRVKEIKDRLALIQGLSYYLSNDSYISISPNNREKGTDKILSFVIKSHNKICTVNDFNLFNSYAIMNQKIFFAKQQSAGELLVKFII